MTIAAHIKTASLGFLLLLSGCSGSYEPSGRADLEKEFQMEFGIPPLSRMAEIRCKTVRVGDTMSKWMAFSLDEAILQRIVTNGFTAASREQLNKSWGSHWQQDLNLQNPNAPNWWRTPKTNQVRVFYREPKRKDFSGSSIFLWIDESNKMVYSKSGSWD